MYVFMMLYVVTTPGSYKNQMHLVVLACPRIKKSFLQLRFAFVHTPAKLWSKDKLSSIMHSCIVMHNMIVEDERRDCDWREEYDFPPDPVPMFRNSLEQHYAIEARTMHMHDKREHL